MDECKRLVASELDPLPNTVIKESITKLSDYITSSSSRSLAQLATTLNSGGVRDLKQLCKEHFSPSLELDDIFLGSNPSSDFEDLITLYNSPKLRKRFIKDTGANLGVIESPLFDDRLITFNLLNEYILFIKIVGALGGESEYLDYYDNLGKQVIESIFSKEGYQKFNSEDMQKYVFKHTLPDKNIFKPLNIGKYFLSMDISQANFNALRCYDSSIFNDCVTWKDYLSNFTNIDYILESKHFREVVLGKCNSKRLQTYQKYIMSSLVEYCYSLGLKYEDIAFVSNDELVIRLGDDDNVFLTRRDEASLYTKAMLLQDYALGEFDVPMHTEVFRLGKIEGTKGYFKSFLSKNAITSNYPIEIKCLEGALYTLVYKTHMGISLNDNDLIIPTDLGLAKLVNKPNVKLSFTSQDIKSGGKT